MKIFSERSSVYTVLVLSAITRIYNLGNYSFWHDEAFGSRLLKFSWPEMITRIGLDVHPPLYYVLIRLWSSLFGSTVFSFRLFSVVFSVLAIVLFYKITRLVFTSPTWRILTLCAFSCSALIFEYSIEMRMYTLGLFWVTLGILAALKLLKNYFSHAPVSYAWVAILAGATIGGMYTHYYALFSFFGIFIGLITIIGLTKSVTYIQKKQYILTLGGSGAIAALSFIPWLKTFFFQIKQVDAGYWIPRLSVSEFFNTLNAVSIHLIDIRGWTLVETFGILIMPFIAVFSFFRYNQNALFRKDGTLKNNSIFNSHPRATILFTVVGFTMPFMCALLFALVAYVRGSNSSIFLVRYFIYTVPFFWLLCMHWLSVQQKRIIQTVGLIFISVAIVANLAGIFQIMQRLNPERFPGMAAASSYILKNSQPTDTIASLTTFEFFNLEHFLFEKQRRSYFYSAGLQNIHALPHFSGTAILKDSDLLRSVNTLNSGTLWLVSTTAFDAPQLPIELQPYVVEQKEFLDSKPYQSTLIVYKIALP